MRTQKALRGGLKMINPKKSVQKMKIALVTGGSSGIGEEISKQLANKGIFVIINYSKSEKNANRVKAEIEKSGGKVLLIKTDVSNEKEVKEMFNIISNKFGKLDYLINNAGIDNPQLIEEYKIDDWNKIMDINLIGKFLCLKYAIPLLKKSSEPKVVNIASRLGQKPMQKESAYCCAEAGIIMLTKVAALELAKYKIKVNTVSPGFTKTPLTEKLFPEKNPWEILARDNPCGRVGTPEDIANAVLFLLSDKADYINGENLNVNGGSILK